MPGIAGIVSRPGLLDRKETVKTMVQCMMHEPFYSSGSLEEVELGVGVGWVSQKGSFSDHMPAWNRAGDICIIFSGEHYSEDSEVAKYGRNGSAAGKWSAAYLADLYEEDPDRFFGKLNGVFSGLVLDLRKHEAVLFNDKFGLSRIYYHQNDKAFYFASEAKALLNVVPQLRHLDDDALAEYFSCGCVLQGRTLFSGISLLPGGAAWTFTPAGDVLKRSYFDKSEWENQPELDEQQFYEQLKSVFARVLPRYFRDGNSIGLSLTGGLDSRIIIACAKSSPTSLPCYTFGGIYRECADVKLSKEIARVVKQSHRTIGITPEFFSQFPNLAEKSVYYSDGAMDATGSVELFANRAAREISPVRMTGNYGSEILRGNIAFRPNRLNSALFKKPFANRIQHAAGTYAGEVSGPRMSFIAFKQVPWHHYGRRSIEQSQLTVRSPYLDNELVRLAYQAPSEPSVNKALAHRLIHECSPGLSRIPTDRGAVGGRVGRIASFWQELLPRAEYIFDYGMPGWLAKLDRACKPFHFERMFLGRQKFQHFRIWYRDELSSYIKNVLLDPLSLSREYLDPREVEKVVISHTKGSANYTQEIHKLLSVELIQRLLINNN